MAVTIKDIARAAGVSSATVSKVLNGSDQHISEKTRNRVKALIRDMDYIPNTAARSLKTSHTNAIGFLLPDIVNPFFPEIVRGIEDCAKDYGYALFLYNTDNDPTLEKRGLTFLNSSKVDGLIFSKILRSVSSEDLRNLGLPIVVVDRTIRRIPDIGQIFIDTEKAFYDSTSYLISQGCRRIAFISADYAPEADKRCSGYRKALKNAGLKSSKSLIYLGSYTAETGKTGAEKIWNAHHDIDGIVCGDDLIAFGVIDYLQQQSVKIPEDVRIIGFDDIRIAKYCSPALSTVHQPAYEMGHEAAEMLIENIIHSRAMEMKELPYHLVIRESA